MPRYRSKMLDTDSIKLGRISFEDAASLKERSRKKGKLFGEKGNCFSKLAISDHNPSDNLTFHDFFICIYKYKYKLMNFDIA